MKSFSPVIPIILFFLTSPGQSQDPDAKSVEELKESILELYGPDQYLVSGIRYYNLYARYDGHRYFEEDKFVKGRLTLDRGTYDDVSLKYDLYGQQVILQVTFRNGSYTEILITDSRLRAFELQGRSFRKLYFPETDTLIFQVIGEGVPACYLYWSKEVIPNSTGPQSVYEFSSMKRKSYVRSHAGLFPFKGARSFSKAFPSHRPQVMGYIRGTKIKLRKASDTEMQGLIQFCRTLENPMENSE